MTANTSKTLAEGVPYGRYQIRKRLARGGMGEVFLADQMGPTGQPIRPVALKRMLPRLARKPHAAQMFLEEMATAAQLNHPNIATTYDFGEVDGTYFMAMEYLEGLSLHQILQALGAIPVAHTIHIVQAILDALDHAHKRRSPGGEAAPVVHRDISPHNIMISINGQVKLLDFGISRAETEALGGRLEGKIAYAAPEQLQGASVDRRSDLWAVGVLMYEALCGVRPYEHNEAHAMVEAAKRGEYPPLNQLRPEAGPLEFIITRSLQCDPDNRWPDAEAMHAALDALAPQFGKVEPEDLAGLVRSSGGPQKSVLGVEHITSFAGAAGEDASNRTATIPLAGEKAAEQLAGEAFYDTRAEGSAAGASGQNQENKNRLALAAIFLLAILIAVLSGLIIAKRDSPSASSSPLIIENTEFKNADTEKVSAKTSHLQAETQKAKPQNTDTNKVDVLSKSVPTIKTEKKRTPKAKKARPKKLRKKRRKSRSTTSGHTPSAKQRPKPAEKSAEKAKPKPASVIATPAPSKPVINNATGRLSVVSTPWARITVDGNALGVTPKLNIQLKPGTHILVLSPGQGKHKTAKELKIKVKPDGHTRVIVNFDTKSFRTLGD